MIFIKGLKVWGVKVKEMDLKNKTRNELLEVAKDLRVKRRTKMNKKELVSSIIEAKREGMIETTKEQLVKEARSFGIKNATSLNKEEFKKVIEKKVREGCFFPPSFYCIHERDYYGCLVYKNNRFCIHGVTKYFCLVCGGSFICKHDKKIFNCYHCSEEIRQEKKNRWTKCGKKIEVDVVDGSEDKSDSDKRDATPCVRVVADWITEGEEEDEVEDEVVADSDGRKFEGERRIRGGCLIEGYDNIYDLVADLNARDD